MISKLEQEKPDVLVEESLIFAVEGIQALTSFYTDKDKVPLEATLEALTRLRAVCEILFTHRGVLGDPKSLEHPSKYDWPSILSTRDAWYEKNEAAIQSESVSRSFLAQASYAAGFTAARSKRNGGDFSNDGSLNGLYRDDETGAYHGIVYWAKRTQYTERKLKELNQVKDA